MAQVNRMQSNAYKCSILGLLETKVAVNRIDTIKKAIGSTRCVVTNG